MRIADRAAPLSRNGNRFGLGQRIMYVSVHRVRRPLLADLKRHARARIVVVRVAVDLVVPCAVYARHVVIAQRRTRYRYALDNVFAEHAVCV